MTLLALLEDFATPAAPEPAPPPEPVPEPALAEEERLAAFEKGYAEGYEDATKAAEEEHRRIGAALAGRLEDLAFTYHEARAAVEREVRALVEAIGDGLLPELAHGAFGPVLVEAVRGEIAGRAACPVTLRVAPDAVGVVAPIMPDVPGFPVSLVGDPDLGEGQAVIGLGAEESEVDVTRLIERAAEALAGWLADADADHHSARQEAAHG